MNFIIDNRLPFYDGDLWMPGNADLDGIRQVLTPQLSHAHQPNKDEGVAIKRRSRRIFPSIKLSKVFDLSMHVLLPSIVIALITALKRRIKIKD